MALIIIAAGLLSSCANNPFQSKTVTDTVNTTAAGVKVETIVTATAADPASIAAALAVMEKLTPLVEDFIKKQPAAVPNPAPIAP